MSFSEHMSKFSQFATVAANFQRHEDVLGKVGLVSQGGWWFPTLHGGFVHFGYIHPEPNVNDELCTDFCLGPGFSRTEALEGLWSVITSAPFKSPSGVILQWSEEEQDFIESGDMSGETYVTV